MKRHFYTKSMLATVLVMALFSLKLWALGTTDCREVLTKYFTATKHPEFKEKDLEEIANELEQAKEISSDEKIYYSQAQKLGKMFEKGLVQRAIAKELEKQGNKGSKKVRSALQIYNAMDNIDRQIDFVDAITTRLIYVIDEDLSTDNRKVDAVAKRAEFYKMTLQEYLDLVKAWNYQRNHNFAVIKLAIAHTIRQQTPEFEDRVASYAGFWARFADRFRKDSVPQPAPQRRDMSYQKLMDGQEAVDSISLKKFIEKSPVSISEMYLDDNYRYLTANQLEECLGSSTLSGNLNPVLQEKLEVRSKELKEDSQKLSDFKKNIKNLDSQITKAEKAKTKLTTPETTEGSIPASSFNAIKNNINDILKLQKKEYSEDPAEGAIRKQLVILGNGSSDQFVEGSLLLYSVARRRLSVAGSYPDILDNLRTLSFKFILSPAQVDQIRSTIISGLDPQDLKKVRILNITNGTWGKALPAEDLQKQQAEITALTDKINTLTAQRVGLQKDSDQFDADLLKKEVE